MGAPISEGIDAAAVFQQTVFGNDPIVVAEHRNQTTTTTGLTRNDFATLSQHPKEAGVQREDVDRLEVAIQIDAKTPEVFDPVKKWLGPAVKDWMKYMVGNATCTS